MHAIASVSKIRAFCLYPGKLPIVKEELFGAKIFSKLRQSQLSLKMAESRMPQSLTCSKVRKHYSLSRPPKSAVSVQEVKSLWLVTDRKCLLLNVMVMKENCRQIKGSTLNRVQPVPHFRIEF